MTYTRDNVIDALRQYTEQHGDAPTLNEWKAQHRRPALSVIVRLFGGWTAALQVADLPTRSSGHWRSDEHNARQDEQTRRAMDRIELGYSLGAVARELGMTGQGLGRRITRYRAKRGLAPLDLRRQRLSYEELEAVQLADPER